MLLALGVLAGCSRPARSGEGQVVDAAMVEGVVGADDPVPRPPQIGHVDGQAGDQPARLRRPLLRGLRVLRRRLHRGRRTRAPVLLGAPAADGARPRRVPAVGPGALAGVQGALRARSSGPGPATSGPRSSSPPRPARRRCWAWARRPSTPTTPPAELRRGRGQLQPGPAPRFSRTPSSVPEPPPEPGADTENALAAWGLDAGRDRRVPAEPRLGPLRHLARADFKASRVNRPMRSGNI